MLSASGCISRPTIEPLCVEHQDLRHDQRRAEEFIHLVDNGLAPNLRTWMIWMNGQYRYNCKLAGMKP